MKEDVLEQVVDDYLQAQGYFTTHNVRFNPSKDHPEYVSRDDSVPSDIDVVGYHPGRTGPDRVLAVSCKSWQTGFDATRILAQLRGEAPNPKRRQELRFRELWLPKWAEGFRRRLEELTGQSQFTYCLAVTHVKGDTAAWAADPTIAANLAGNPLRFLPLETMWSEVLAAVTTTPAASEIGRLAQLLKAAGLTAPQPVVAPAGPTPGTPAALADLQEQGEVAGVEELSTDGALS
jgi:hypothetical protein